MFNFKKIASVLASAVMLSSTMGFAAAASYPEPFVTGGAEDVAIVVGLNADVSDVYAAIDVQDNLNALVTSGSASSGSKASGDSVLLAKSSDNLNVNNNWGVFTGTIDDSDLSTTLADGSYVAGDNDDFDYNQKISIGTPTLNHFRDSDYESLLSLDQKTPAMGFKMTSSTWVLNYTLDFIQDAESTVTSSDLDDIEGSEITILGKKYYVSDMKNSTLKMTLLDSATTSTISEGEVIVVDGREISINYIDATNVVFTVDGARVPSTGKLQQGSSAKLSDGSYLGVRDISKLVIAGSTGSSSFSIGSGKLELTPNTEIKMNDQAVNGVKAYITRGTYSNPDEKIDKIIIEWRTDEEVFLTPESELVMPGFESVKFTMADLMRPEDEKITVQKDGDTSMSMTVPIKDGPVTFNFLYANSTGEFLGIGKAQDERLATTSSNTFEYYEKNSSGDDYHKYFIASYNVSAEAQSYLLRAKVSQDTTQGRNETTIDRYVDGAWSSTKGCEEKAAGDTCDIGDVSLTLGGMNYTSGGTESIKITAGTNVNFHTIYTAGGLRIYLPIKAANSTTGPGDINFTSANTAMTGHDQDSFYLYMDGENKDDTIAAGTQFSFTIDDSSNKLQVSAVNTTGGGVGSTTGENGLEVGQSTGVYDSYVRDDVAPMIKFFSKSDNDDYAEVYYPSGDSETYAEVFLAEVDSVVTPGSIGSTGSGGNVVVVKDNEVSSVNTKNLIVVGGSCINTVAAKILGFDTSVCGADFTAATEVGAGEYIIKTVESPYATDKVAMLVAGYEKAQTVSAVAKVLEGVTSDADTSQVYPIASAAADTTATE